MKLNFRIISKAGLLLVIVGFFMPLVRDMNALEFAATLMATLRAFDAMLLYMMLISAITGAGVGVKLLKGNIVKTKIDWATILISIVCGLIVYFSQLMAEPELQYGAYVIATGWIISLLAQFVSTIMGEV